MTLLATKLTKSNVANNMAWNTTLDASDTTAKETLGAIREDYHSVFGYRKFMYVRFDQSGGADLDQLCSFSAPLAVNNITSGTTTSIVTSGLTADKLVGGLLVCIDDAGGAGAAPEGECGVIIENTTTTIRIDSDDAFSAAPAVNDDFKVLLPWAVVDSADTDYAYEVAGVAMAAQAQYDYGWVQFFGLHPSVAAVAAGTAIPATESVVAGANVINDGAGDAIELRIGVAVIGLSSDTVLRKTPVNLCCGPALTISQSTA